MRAFLSFPSSSTSDSRRVRTRASRSNRVSKAHVWLSGLFVLSPLCVASPASAYCTLRTCQDITQAQADASDDENVEAKVCDREDNCIVEGHELFWETPCLSFGVSALNTSVLGLTPDEFHDIIQDAYQVWEGVECQGGGHPNFHVGSVGIVDSNGNFFCEEEPLANISVWSLVTRWSRDPSALGYTSSTHNKKDGEIFDADVELNLNKIENEHEGNYAIVLGRIAVHEAGHYLGLAHSSIGDAVMYESYNAFELLTKELSQDDIDGICELYPPDGKLECSDPGYVEAGLDAAACAEAAQEAEDDEDETSATCAVRGVGQRSGRPWLAVGFAFGLVSFVAARKRNR